MSTDKSIRRVEPLQQDIPPTTKSPYIVTRSPPTPSIRPQRQPIQYEPLSDAEDVKMWTDVNVVLYGWKYLIDENALGKDDDEKIKNSRIIISTINKYDKDALYTVEEKDGKIYFSFFFSLSGKPNDVLKAVLNISRILHLFKPQIVESGEAYVIFMTDEKSGKRIDVNIPDGTKIDDAYELVLNDALKSIRKKEGVLEYVGF